MLQVKIFSGYVYQQIEEEFNRWAAVVKPYIVKTALQTTAIPRKDMGFSIFYTMAIFFNSNEPPEVITGSRSG